MANGFVIDDENSLVSLLGMRTPKNASLRLKKKAVLID